MGSEFLELKIQNLLPSERYQVLHGGMDVIRRSAKFLSVYLLIPSSVDGIRQMRNHQRSSELISRFLSNSILSFSGIYTQLSPDRVKNFWRG